MENYKVYYGEYSLHHWIKLILSKKIELPSYQRNFVWSEDKVKKLIKSLKDGLFVPPVIIGTYFEEGLEKHYIIDGQQRLSAILLAYLGKFPNKGFEKESQPMADENDNNDTDNEENINIKDWKLECIQAIAEHTKKEEIIQKLSEPKYKKLEITNLPEDFFENTVLGFSYIKPNQQNYIEQKRYYSSVFRNINISGQQLTPEESRSSLYWLDSRLEPFFKPSLADDIIIDGNKIDFARYLAFAAEYLKNYQSVKNIQSFNIAKGYGTKIKPFEIYIENFVYHCVGEISSSTFPSPNDIFSDTGISYSERVNNIIHILRNVRGDTKFTSIIDADFYIFGLIFWHLFLFKSFDSNKFNQLKNCLDERIYNTKQNLNYLRRPSSIGRIRERIYESITEYKNIIME